MKILIVDDDIISRAMLRSILEDGGYTSILEAEDGQSAWNMVQSTNPELVISDINMPRLSGLELLKQIRSSDLYSSIKVILITSMNDRETVLHAAHLEVSAYIIKPFDSASVIEKIRHVRFVKHSTSVEILLPAKIVTDRLSITYDRYLQLVELLVDDIGKNLILFEHSIADGLMLNYFTKFDAMKGACMNMGATSFLRALERTKNNLFSGNVQAALKSLQILRHELQLLQNSYQSLLQVRITSNTL